PLLSIHGDRDEIVPFRMGRRVHEAATVEKGWYTIEGAGHNDTFPGGGAPYLDAIRDFVTR
ncbi:MAG: alpha/beta hydrolase, partial [Planctomycetota bacterium]